MPQQQLVRIEIHGQLGWRICRSPNQNWVAVCDPLKITLEGETFEELTQRINEGLQVLLLDLFDTGDYADFFKRHGWRPSIDPSQIDLRRARFDVPFSTRLEEPNASGREVVCT